MEGQELPPESALENKNGLEEKSPGGLSGTFMVVGNRRCRNSPLRRVSALDFEQTQRYCHLDAQVDCPCSNRSTIKTSQVENGHVELEVCCRPCCLWRNEDGKNYFAEVQSDAMITLARYSIGEYSFETTKARTVRLSELLKPHEEPDRVPVTHLPLWGPWWLGTEPRQLGRPESLQFSVICVLDCPEEIPMSQWIDVYCVPLLIVEMETGRYELAMWESYEGLVLVPVNETDLDLEAVPSTRTFKQETFEGDAETAPRTFRRIGIFLFTINNRDRENCENELFGTESEPSVITEQEGKGIISSHFENSRKIKIRIIWALDMRTTRESCGLWKSIRYYDCRI
ncbi:hypothetical protein BDZ45DRAFT_761620 [Acephala macrosclerotiorum]|nr:hypothetical protein BDZ45DRAFT_761620 [Acephala macrosclerotiorum]